METLGDISMEEARTMRAGGATLAQVAERAGCSVATAWHRLVGVEAKRDLRVGSLPLAEAKRMREAGATVQAIADEAGVSKQRVSQMLGERDVRRQVALQARRIRALEQQVRMLARGAR